MLLQDEVVLNRIVLLKVFLDTSSAQNKPSGGSCSGTIHYLSLTPISTKPFQKIQIKKIMEPAEDFIRLSKKADNKLVNLSRSTDTLPRVG